MRNPIDPEISSLELQERLELKKYEDNKMRRLIAQETEYLEAITYIRNTMENACKHFMINNVQDYVWYRDRMFLIRDLLRDIDTNVSIVTSEEATKRTKEGDEYKAKLHKLIHGIETLQAQGYMRFCETDVLNLLESAKYTGERAQ